MHTQLRRAHRLHQPESPRATILGNARVDIKESASGFWGKKFLEALGILAVPRVRYRSRFKRSFG